MTPLHSGSPTYNGEVVHSSHFTSLIQASAMYCGPPPQRSAKPRATSLRTGRRRGGRLGEWARSSGSPRMRSPRVPCSRNTRFQLSNSCAGTPGSHARPCRVPRRATVAAPTPSFATRSTTPAARERRLPEVHCQESGSALVLSSSTSLAAIIVVETVSKEIGADLRHAAPGRRSGCPTPGWSHLLHDLVLEIPRQDEHVLRPSLEDAVGAWIGIRVPGRKRAPACGAAIDCVVEEVGP
jgi:hypothetical protein